MCPESWNNTVILVDCVFIDMLWQKQERGQDICFFQIWLLFYQPVWIQLNKQRRNVRSKLNL